MMDSSSWITLEPTAAAVYIIVMILQFDDVCDVKVEKCDLEKDAVR